jgi:hypothetical protein
MCAFVNFKIIKLKASQKENVTKIASICLQICKITKKYKLQVHFCIFTSLHMLNLHVFILATNPWPSLQVYKFPSLQNNFFYGLQINNYNFTISQIASACLQVHKSASMQPYKFPSLKKNLNYKLQINNYNFTNCNACLQVHKLQVCKFASLQN